MSGRAAVLARLSVSRETAERLDAFVAALQRWTPRINLVSRGSLPLVWTRHVEDCAQLLPLAHPDARTWLDLGAGAGLPGLVIAALAPEKHPHLAVTLIESDERKAIFLRAAAREMGVDVTILAQRIEASAGIRADVVSARALAPLTRLLDYATPLRAPGGLFIFPKGANADSELTDAQRHWHIRHETHRSATDPAAVILVIQESTRVDAPTG